MTVLELTNYICTKVGQTDTASTEACRLFLRRRYRLLWDYALWQESLAVTTVVVPALTPVCTMPAPCDQVVAVRRGDAALPVLDQTVLMRTAPGAFEAGGPLTGFALEAPSCLRVAVPPDGVTEPPCLGYRIVSTSAEDATQLLRLTGLGLRPDADDVPRPVRESLALNGLTAMATVHAYAHVASAVLSAPCAGEVRVLDADSAIVAVLPPGETSLAPLPRFRLFGARPGERFAVLFKRACLDLDDDSAEPELRTGVNALLALATADMLERQRQYAKAQLKLKEGEQEIAVMLDLEKNQSAHEQRLVPAEIHAGADDGDVFGLGGKGIW